MSRCLIMRKCLKIIAFIILIFIIIIAFFAIVFQINYVAGYNSAVSQCNELYEYYSETIRQEVEQYINVSESLYSTIDDSEIYSEELMNLIQENTENALKFNSAYVLKLNSNDCLIYNYLSSNGNNFMFNISICYTRNKEIDINGYERISDNFLGKHYVTNRGII